MFISISENIAGTNNKTPSLSIISESSVEGTSEKQDMEVLRKLT